ncbi:hypothetical protein RradSPS_1030 [Rubrobacter radiotolerans]|uniref:Glycoside hydrolase n=1 Tax=Rubrobacter radiotolerans TaxID=42256 RepID=A0A023X1U4_RUBRA|nr:putative glycoside hydrolase [Rubrobacter radiotolerans]AHY46313.1 hypothetical protein RradSPS_1030 [Rubrobacter radiotolerans]MDX5893720.1 putative glycoside hydrolase [Rubrobacter radiotolerans]
MIGLLVLLALALLALFFLLSMCSALSERQSTTTAPDAGQPGATGGVAGTQGEPEATEATEADRPQRPVRGIYLTAASASDLSQHLPLIEETDVNAVVVDVKDVTGEVMHASEVPLANEVGATRDVLDLEALTTELREREVYSIARIATFEDDILPVARPDLAVTDSATGAQWTNNVGNYWSDPYNRTVWEYNVAIAKEAAEAGFDEVQFDYVRFPSDGPMERVVYPAQPEDASGNVIGDFLAYAKGELEPTGVSVAADVFGLAAGEDGAGVGQDIPALAPHLDVISPMIYPSHYPAGSYGFDNPNARPYAVVAESMREFEEATREANPDIEIRPWLQDFSYGEPAYGPRQVSRQIDAVYDAGATGWLLWNPENVYTWQALTDTGSPEEEQQ